ncbi:MAG: site-specific DNA-methyltransferase, partial [Hymenobacteraceae bacterium]|nr:site-specific DNA-methyltransferase [Hymenobacteraceae bacterium]
METITKNHPLSQSQDIVTDNIEKLKQLFPHIFTEGKIDFEALKATLGERVEIENERYQFTWKGKAKAMREAHKTSTGTLRPCPEESVNWNNTQNLFIEGDNLEVLKLLQKSYHGRIKMIYIDPPYNTGKDFVYKDNYKDNLRNYQAFTGQINEEGLKQSTNSETSGRYHSNWLNMMYPRLKLARNLLKEDGVIFISIDDNEVDNLKKVCNEIFGEKNFIAQIAWKSKSGGSADERYIVKELEYILLFSKNIDEVVLGKVSKVGDERYCLQDNFIKERGKYLLKKLDYRMTSEHYTESLNYPIIDPDGNELWPGGEDFRQDGGWNWRWSREKVKWG